MTCYLVAYIHWIEGIEFDSTVKVFLSRQIAEDYAKLMNYEYGFSEHSMSKYEIKEIPFNNSKERK